MKQKVLAFLLAAFMVMGLAACGSGGSGEADSQKETVSDNQENENKAVSYTHL